jgi:ATP-dependent DNA helicase RecG
VLRSLVQQHLDALLPLVQEVLPAAILHEGWRAVAAGRVAHGASPHSVAEALTGRARLAFEELLYVQILHRARTTWRGRLAHGTAFINKRELTRNFDRRCRSFSRMRRCAPSRDRRRHGKPRRMHRLLQGDVGSGKTVVAVFAALLAMENDRQVALMAPTELLAEQHARTCSALLAPLGISPVLLTGGLGAKERRLALTPALPSHEPVLANWHARAGTGRR